jgi:hypothetical protein
MSERVSQAMQSAAEEPSECADERLREEAM